jgi:hypothetical protein
MEDVPMSQITLSTPAKSALVRVGTALSFAAIAAVVAFGPAGAADEKK